MRAQFLLQLWAQAPLRSPLQPAVMSLIRGVMSIGSVLGYPKPGIRQSQGAGLGWLAFLSPALTQHLLPYILSAGLGEVALAPWLLVAGVNSAKWKEQARVGRASRAYAGGSEPSPSAR
jgi:hypothetical protein